MHIGIAFVGLD